METLKAFLSAVRALLAAWLGWKAKEASVASATVEKIDQANKVAAQVDAMSDATVHDELSKWRR